MPPNSSETIDDLLADPLIQAIMQADRVDAASLRGLLKGVAAVVADRRTPMLPVSKMRFGAGPNPMAPVSPRWPAIAAVAGRQLCLRR